MSRSTRRTHQPQFYYGWIIVGVALVSMAFWLGIRSSFSVFYVALLEEFHWTRAGSAGVQSMALLIYTLLAPLVGALIDRFGPRRVVVPGILVLALGLVLCSRIETLNQFYLFYGVVLGTGITCIGIITYSAILAHWFEKKRGLASGIAVSGILMRHVYKVEIVSVKELAMGLVSFQPIVPEGIGLGFFVHLFLVSALFAYFPFSKLMHLGGVFMSPTRNLVHNSRVKRHINPWNYEVHTHTYEEYEDEFREVMREAGLPLEKAD